MSRTTGTVFLVGDLGRSDLLISRREGRCLFLMLGPWACGQHLFGVVHHVHRAADALAPDGHRRAVAERLMWASIVVEGDPIGEPLVQLAAVGVALEVDVLVFEAAPQPL